MDLPEGLVHLLREQSGLVTVAQLDALGVSRATRRHALARRWWRMVLPRVVLVGTGALTPRQRLVAALLFAGPEAAIAASTAAAWHGVEAADGEQVVRLVVPADRTVRAQGFVVVRRTRRWDERLWERPPLRICSPARAVVDAAREAWTLDAARAVVIEAARRRIVRVEDLRTELEDGPRQGSALARRAIQAAEAGAWSVAEVDLAVALRHSVVLPPVMLNPDLVTPDGTVLPRPDGWIDEVGLAIQVHSKRHHHEEADWEATVLSDGIYAEYGIPVVAMTPTFFTRDPAAAVRRVERAYTAALAMPRPDVLALPVGHGLVC